MANETGLIVKVGTMAAAGLTAAGAGLVVLVGTLKGLFVTRSECQLKSETCLFGIREEIAGMKDELAKGNKKFENAERYLSVIADRLEIKAGDIPEL